MKRLQVTNEVETARYKDGGLVDGLLKEEIIFDVSDISSIKKLEDKKIFICLKNGVRIVTEDFSFQEIKDLWRCETVSVYYGLLKAIRMSKVETYCPKCDSGDVLHPYHGFGGGVERYCKACGNSWIAKPPCPHCGAGLVYKAGAYDCSGCGKHVCEEDVWPE